MRGGERERAQFPADLHFRGLVLLSVDPSLCVRQLDIQLSNLQVAHGGHHTLPSLPHLPTLL